MQTLTEQLEEALKRLFLYVTDQDAFEAKYGAPEFPDSSINVEGWLDLEVRGPARSALARYRADPEALLRENGEAVRRTGNALMAKRSPKTGTPT